MSFRTNFRISLNKTPVAVFYYAIVMSKGCFEFEKPVCYFKSCIEKIVKLREEHL